MPESKFVTFVTDDRKGKKPTSVLSVEMEEELKAGHALEPDKDIQLCARTVDALLASRMYVAAWTNRDLDARLSSMSIPLSSQ